ncbi:MAG TPA: hypothetical protein VFR21_29610 [Bradyrhizobium sp.]|nr:hypothetical protein [Bradyrhizobium sp.]
MHAIRNTLGFVMVASLAMTVPHYRASAEERQVTGFAPAAKTGPTLVGTWQVSFTRPPARGYALVTFTSDGTSVRTTDRSPGMSPSHGAWQQIKEGEFQAIWHAFKFDPSGAHIGNQSAIFRVTMNPDGNSFTGAGKGVTHTLDGKLIESETAEGPFEGTRVVVNEHYNK